MKKLTAGIFATLLTVVTVGAANADIASTAYVDQEVGTVEGQVTTLTQTVNTKADQSALESLSDTVDLKANSADVYTQGAADAKFQTQANISSSADAVVTDAASETKYPSVAAAHAIAEAASATVSGDLTSLEATVTGQGERLTAAEGDIDTLQEGVAAKQDKNIPGAKNQILVTDGTGNITTSAAIANTQVSGLGKLSTKDQVAAGDIAAGAITNANISDTAAIAASKISGLATVATSGSYNDLQNKPTLGALAAKDQVAAGDIAAGAIKNADISDTAAIAVSKISGLGNLATMNTVGAAQIDTNAVTTEKIANANVTEAKLEQTVANKINAAIPAPSAEQVNSNGLYVLTYNNGQYAWEDITRASVTEP